MLNSRSASGNWKLVKRAKVGDMKMTEWFLNNSFGHQIKARTYLITKNPNGLIGTIIQLYIKHIKRLQVIWIHNPNDTIEILGGDLNMLHYQRGSIDAVNINDLKWNKK